MPKTQASWYDPTLGGINGSPNATPCGVPVSRLPWSVAHKTAPCGTIVTIAANGKVVQTVVADRGPFVRGRGIDMRKAVAQALGIDGVQEVEYVLHARRIDLHKMANLGGTPLAFQNASIDKDHPKGLIPMGNTDPGSILDPVAEAIVNNVPGAKLPGDAAQAVYNAGDAAVNGVGDFLHWVSDPSTWFRIGKGALGFVFVVAGTGAIVYVVANKANANPALKAVKKVI